MALFTISDPHLSLGTDKPMDIFRGWSDYVQRFESNWRHLIGDNDTVIIPGDISWAMRTQDAVCDLGFINSLPGRKIIGKGNHDYWWNTMNKLQKLKTENKFDTIDFLFNNAFRIDDIAVCGSRGWFFDDKSEDVEKVVAREAGRLKLSAQAALALGGTPVAFMHYPVVCDNQVCEPFLEVLKEFGITRVYFGHIHGSANSALRDYVYDGIKFSLVSADYLGFMPRQVFL